MSKILVIRFSALGDVAMTVPVLYSFAKHYPQHELVVVSRKNMAPLFKDSPANITFRGVDLKADYKGIAGLNRLYALLKAEKADAVADLHDVLRSKYIRWRFRLSGTPVASINKGRKGKKKLTAKSGKQLFRQKTSFQRYADVFVRLGFTFPLQFHSIFDNNAQPLPPHVSQLLADTDGKKPIGIAPFAAHQGKIYPTELQETVIRTLSEQGDVHVYLFGGGKKEQEFLEAWQMKYPRVTSVAGKLSMDEELRLMNRLCLMVSMDSGNMHLASLVGTPVISIWGATHPYAGFMGWGQDEANALQTELPCRPCSIYGNKPCLRGDYACLNQIAPETVVRKINETLHAQ